MLLTRTNHDDRQRPQLPRIVRTARSIGAAASLPTRSRLHWVWPREERSSRLRSIVSGRSFGLISGLAAAAAIAVMIGAGLLLFGDHPGNGTPTSTPVVYASDPDSPIAGSPTAQGTSVAMFGGSPAQNEATAGTVPTSGNVSCVPDIDQGTSFSAFFGSVLYVEGAAYDLHVTTTLSAYDSGTGQLLWQTTVLTAPLTVFDGGVVVLQPASGESGDTTVTYQVSLLDRMSGAIKWTVPGTFSVEPTDVRGLGWIGWQARASWCRWTTTRWFCSMRLREPNGGDTPRPVRSRSIARSSPAPSSQLSWGNTLYLVDHFATRWRRSMSPRDLPCGRLILMVERQADHVWSVQTRT